MSELQYTFAYIFLGILVFGLACAVVRVFYLRFGSIDDRSTYGDDYWRDQ